MTPAFENYKCLNAVAEKNSVVLFGGTLDKKIPVAEFIQSFDFNFKIYNRSFYGLSIRDAKNYFVSCIQPIQPEALLIHIGAEDLDLFRKSSVEFDNLYIDLLQQIRLMNPKCRITLVSLDTSENTQIACELNRHIKAIADSEKCEYFNMENSKLWNPNVTKEVVSFVYNLGFEQRLTVSKPLRDIAKILYSYVYTNNISNDLETQFAV